MHSDQVPQAAYLSDKQIQDAWMKVPHREPQRLADRAIADAATEQAYRVGVAETEAKYLAITYCAYCSEQFPIDGDAALVSEHIRTCSSHPMRDMAAALQKLHDAIDDFNASGVYETALCALPQCKALGFNATGGIIHVDNCAIVIARSALAKHNASQGPEASHAE